jgi:4'-phosphopantetheinyl transferase
LDNNSSSLAISTWTSAERVAAQARLDCIDIWRICFPQPPDLLDAMNTVLSAVERQRSARFAFPADRAQYTIIHGALRILLGTIMDQQPGAIAFEVSENGKPRVAGVPRAPRFNLSHTKDIGLLAISPSAEVGVDDEFRRFDFPCMKIAERFFSMEESQCLRTLAADIQREAFFTAWVRKEAWLKTRGASLGALRHLNVGIEKSFRDGTLWPADRAAGDFPTIWLQDLSVAPGYSGAIALEEPADPFTPRLRCLDWQAGSQYDVPEWKFLEPKS